MALSFLKGKKLVVPMKNAGAKKGDPVTLAKGKIIEGITTQKHYASLTHDSKALPTGKDGKRTASTWFHKQGDGWVTTIRYGQLPLPLDDKGTTGVMVGASVADLPPFYDAVIESIRKGELDTIIGDLRTKRSASLTGKTGGGRKKAS